MNKKLFGGFLGASAALVLAACGNKNASTDSTVASPVDEGFKTSVTNEGTAISGGTLNYAILSDSPFAGHINPVTYIDSADGSLVGLAYDSIFSFDANRKIDNENSMAEYTLDRDNKIFTVHLKSADYKWSDGEPLNIDDYIFTYEVIGRPDYAGVRYDRNAANIEGMEEFHNGDATSISGLEKVDDQTVRIHLKEVYPSLELGGGAIQSNIIPKHIFDGMTYDELESSDASHTKVVGNGPFIVDNVVSGESVSFKKNPYYWRGVPKLDGVKADIVSNAQVVAEMQAGHYDIASGMPADQYEAFSDFNNETLLGYLTNNISYVGFDLGHWDAEKKQHVLDPDKKMADPALRQAMGYALDNDTVGKETYHGLRVRANTLLSPFFKDVYADKDQVPGFEYNPEKAKQLLEDAGYKDVDGDGIRENKDGSKLTITMLAPSGSETDEAVTRQYMTWWKEVGLDVELLNGRTLDFNAYAQKLQKFSGDFDMWLGAFTIGYNPNPDGLYGPTAAFNFGHFVEPEHTALLDQIASNVTFDEDKKKELFLQWQQYVQNNPFNVPRFNNYSLTAVNNRVKYYDVDPNSTFGWQDVELVSDTGVAATN